MKKIVTYEFTEEDKKLLATPLPDHPCEGLGTVLNNDRFASIYCKSVIFVDKFSISCYLIYRKVVLPICIMFLNL